MAQHSDSRGGPCFRSAILGDGGGARAAPLKIRSPHRPLHSEDLWLGDILSLEEPKEGAGVGFMEEAGLKDG